MRSYNVNQSISVGRGSININGTNYSGNNIIINNGEVMIDGKKVNSEEKHCY